MHNLDPPFYSQTAEACRNERNKNLVALNSCGGSREVLSSDHIFQEVLNTVQSEIECNGPTIGLP
jgi:hypothetical protein